eukprot:CAMPEP_0117662932 /NCGR_PEP_ID=MMETSP0804-20121206/8315_1 /TAXON_ID=1074897 /ORGANISM="Tetraselmis astigmatica, Strain CCMP880" /LENGTH=747 /DNA_ID=CAMNT_0005469861 /DNA_START=284 /DNA_END=2527 /DNA_ORIENTATION=+
MNDKRPIELEEGWETMARGIMKLKRLLENEPEEQFNVEEYMNLYTTIYNMCTQKPPHDYSEQLYNRYKEAFNLYISEKVLPTLLDHYDEYLLQELVNRWDNHKIMVRWLSRFFNYLDRYYVQRHSLPGLNEVGLICFRDSVYAEIHVKAKNAVLKLVEAERDGEQINRPLVKNVLAIFQEVGMSSMEKYEHDFENYLLAETAAFYQMKASAWVQEDSCPDYMLKAEKRLELEEERVDHYLHVSTKEKLLREVQSELLAKYETELLEKEHSGCAALLRDDKTEDLGRMYRLFNRIPKGLEPVADIFRKHVEAEGMALVKEVTEAAQQKKEKDSGKSMKGEVGGTHEQMYVRKVIELHDKYMEYVKSCFSNSSLFHKALKEAFEAFCNKNVTGSSSAELMANFCDNLLKKGGTEKLSDDEIEATLDKVVELLAYISDKDLFAEFYRKKLSRRLLFDKSASEDHERSILSKLKEQCGAQFTSKMEGMVKDLRLAREKQQEFDNWQSGRGTSVGIDLTVTVLTTGFWPTYKAMDLALPEEMVSGVESFKEFYEATTKHRKLSWIFALGTCHIMGHFKAKKIELVISTFQAALLLLFNQEDSMTFNEVKERMNLPEEDILRLLHSLSCSKYKILTKNGNAKNISKEDTFSFNADFNDRMKRIKISLPVVDEKKKVVEDVDKDRRYAIDAAIVRTMKSRKQLQHQQLILEVVQQLTRMFKPDFKMIKKRIEDLIAREYLERDSENSNLFRYLA